MIKNYHIPIALVDTNYDTHILTEWWYLPTYLAEILKYTACNTVPATKTEIKKWQKCSKFNTMVDH